MKNPIQLLILEDELDYQVILKAFIRTMHDIQYHLASNYDEAVYLLKNHKFDIALLDIELGPNAKSGLDVAKKIRERDIHLPIVFLTNNFTNTYYESVKKLNAYSFLDKQLSSLKLRQAIELALNRPQDSLKSNTKSKQHLLVKIGNKYKKISTNEIEFFFRQDGISYISLGQRKYPLHKSLADLEIMFKDFFVRIHQSYLVNIEKVLYVDMKNHNAVLEDAELPIGYTYRKKTLSVFTLLQ